MPSLQNGQTHWNNLSAAANNLKVLSLLPHPQSKTLIISFPKLHTRDKFAYITSNFDQCCKWSRDIKDEKKIFFQIVLVWFGCCFKMAIRRRFCYWANDLSAIEHMALFNSKSGFLLFMSLCHCDAHIFVFISYRMSEKSTKSAKSNVVCFPQGRQDKILFNSTLNFLKCSPLRNDDFKKKNTWE